MPSIAAPRRSCWRCRRRLTRDLTENGVTIQTVLPGATRTEIWERAGTDVNKLPPERVMEVDELVDAALKGLDAGRTHHHSLPARLSGLADAKRRG